MSEYYKWAVWYPFLDCTLQFLWDKFLSHQLTLLTLVALVQSVVNSYEWTDVVNSCRLYQSQILYKDEVHHEHSQYITICLEC